MTISIITVVYNNAETIGAAITSVLSQTYKDIEYIIIDGNSADGTMEVIRQYSKDIKQILSEPDLGIYDAMNKGIRLATGEVIGILNSDDIYADEFVIADIMKVFLSDLTLDMVYGDLVYVKNNDLSKVVRKWKSLPYYPLFFENGHVPPHPSLFIKKLVYNKAGVFNMGFRLAADYEFMLRILKLHNLNSKYIPRLCVKMRLGGSTNSSLKNIIKGNIEILRSWKQNGLKPPFMLMPLKIIKRLLQFVK